MCVTTFLGYSPFKLPIDNVRGDKTDGDGSFLAENSA